jgi:molybdopterin converting factor subunit 1
MLSVSATLRVRVLFFGRLRELSGISDEPATVPAGATLADLFSIYATRFPQLAEFGNSLVASRNQEFAAWNTLIAAGDEIAFLPPVSGG